MPTIEGTIRATHGLGAKAQIYIVDGSISGALQDAIDAAVANSGDLILVQRAGHEVTQTVTFNKTGIMVKAIDDGFNPLAKGEYHSVYAAEAFIDGPVATVIAPCLIEGLAFASRDPNALFWGGAAMLIGGLASALPFGVHIKNCRFPKWGWDNRIGIAVEGTTDVLIEKCTFEGVGSALRAGIYLQGAMQNITIRRNHFRQCTAAVLLGAFAGGGPHMILGPDNVVQDGYLLETDTNSANGSIIGNYSDLAVGNAYDRTVTQLKAQGLQPSGNHYLESN